MIAFIFLSASCKADLKLGAERTDAYLDDLDGKRIGMLVNHTSVVGDTHLVDFLVAKGLEVSKIFSPEHGFRGTADAGEEVKDGVDEKTGIQVVSLYGNNKKPTKEQLENIDLVIFDIQDVGVRFYTYISSMHYMMEACAEYDIPMMVFDRPNPNGHYFDGPILEPEFQSFVGMHPIPVVHGLTVGELANMINGEGWLKNAMKCDLSVIDMEGYVHSMPYSLPIKPSPNLPNDQSIKLYPSLCFFEGTYISIGRGTYFPFQVIGYPDPDFGAFEFVPESIVGMSKNPKHKGMTCYGEDLRVVKTEAKLDLGFILKYHNLWRGEEDFFKKYFDTLAGTDKLRQQIIDGMTEQDIRATWQDDLEQYRLLRQKYVLYKD